MRYLLVTVLVFFGITGYVSADERSKWPKIDGIFRIAKTPSDVYFVGTAKSDELLGGDGSDTLYGLDQDDVLWADHLPCCQPTTQKDLIVAGRGNDWIYDSHGVNRLDAGEGNDILRVKFAQAGSRVRCGPGRDLVYTSRTVRARVRWYNCERFTYGKIR